MLKQRLLPAIAIALLAVGCHRQQGNVLGKAPKGTPATILGIRAGDTPPVVTITGLMVEKCPVAGCWLKVQDATGTIMVDTKSAGFMISILQLNVPGTERSAAGSARLPDSLSLERNPSAGEI